MLFYTTAKFESSVTGIQKGVLCDLVQCYKNVYKLVDLPMEDFFLIDFNYHNLRGGGGGGHSLQLKPVGSLSVYSSRYNFFSQRL